MTAEGVRIWTELPSTENSPPVIGLRLVGTWGPRSKGPCQRASLGLRV